MDWAGRGFAGSRPRMPLACTARWFTRRAFLAAHGPESAKGEGVVRGPGFEGAMGKTRGWQIDIEVGKIARRDPSWSPQATKRFNLWEVPDALCA